MNQSEEKWENLIFEGIKGDWRGLKVYLKNLLGKFLSPIHLLPNYQILDNSDVQILRYRVTDGRTDERTDGRTNVIP